MTLFNKLKDLKSKSQSAISIFTRTIDDLKNINSSIQVEIDKNTDRIKVIQEENTEYTKVFTENNSIINKIENILK